MKYLVLRRFRTYGKLLYKGDIVDESQLRSPRLFLAEGRIVPAVSSSIVPDEGLNNETPLKELKKEDKIKLGAKKEDKQQTANRSFNIKK